MMNKEEFILNILSLQPGVELSPLQIQKLFFLLEKRLGDEAKYFHFEPYFYGPYDKALSQSIRELLSSNKLLAININNINHYAINPSAQINNSFFLNTAKQTFIKELINFVKNKSFRELCFSIYKEFPEMAEKSVLLGQN